EMAEAAAAASRFRTFLAGFTSESASAAGAPLLIERNQVLRGQWPETSPASMKSTSSNGAPAAKTVWELLHDVIHPSPPAGERHDNDKSAESTPTKHRGRYSDGETI